MRALSLSLVSVAAMVTAASAQPRPVAPKVVRACGVTALPLSVGNSWTYEPTAPPPDRALTDAQLRNTPLPPKKLVVTVTGVETKEGVTTVSLSEELDGRVHPTTITCRAGGAEFRMSPTAFWFTAEPGTTYGIELSDVERKGHTLELNGGKVIALEWHDDLTAKWKHVATGKAPDGRCLDTPAEPIGSTLCSRVRQRSYPVREQSGVVFAYLGPEGSAPPALPAFDAFTAPATHSFAFKGLWRCNWLQAVEVGMDPAHPSFLHRYLQDDTLDATGQKEFGRQFRAASVGAVDGERWPMTRVMREVCSPEIRFDEVAPGLTRLTALRLISERLTHVRVTHAAFPQTFVIPLSETVTITQMHLPVDDTHTYWYSFFTSFAAPLDKETMRSQRLAHMSLPDYAPLHGRHDDWNFDPAEQRTRTFLGMGEDDINLHDQWAVESMGAIQDRTREHLGSSDKVIMANRRMLLKAIETVRNSGTPPMVLTPAEAAALTGPDTMDCIAPADTWQAYWQEAAAAKRQGAPWLSAATAATAATAA